jgi:DNA-binding response OmpR family regulator
LEEIAEQRPSMMLLDIMMPVMDGWTVLDRMRQFPADERPKVVVVSARSSRRDRAKAMELGADAFAAKPFSMDELIGIIHGLEG